MLQHDGCIATSTVRGRQPTKEQHICSTDDLRLQLLVPSLQQCLSLFRAANVTPSRSSDNQYSYCTSYRRFKSDNTNCPKYPSFASTTMSLKVSRRLRRDQLRYKHYFSRKFLNMFKFWIGQFVHVDRLPLVTLPADSNSENTKNYYR